eukprot:TRINITY_DN12605_c0_g1_i1.p1 TRINITY_DN12605_c0_g1~~TRINITY_DN12605_c0_g1_i1.p1  ORF type:complete len:409 (+),score=191.06 TRINITY_DN12605_c0_g1_i1:69-1229(+)
MFAPMGGRVGDGTRLTYETELTPEEEIELLYAPVPGSSHQLGEARPGSPARRYARPSVKRQQIISSLAAGLPTGTAGDGSGLVINGDQPFHKRVWYPSKQAGVKKPAAVPVEPVVEPAKPKDRRKAGPQLLKLILQSVNPNLKLVVVALWGEAEEVKGVVRISLAGYVDALRGLGVDDLELITNTFELLLQDREDTFVVLEDVVRAMEIVVNGRGAKAFAKESFDLFAGLGGTLYFSKQAPAEGFDADDFIHVAKLVELRRLRIVERMPPRTYLMVKTLLNLYSHQRKAEEENFLANFGKKGKKAKKKKPPQMSAMRLRDEMKDYHRSRHISLKEFAASMGTSSELVAAFLPVALRSLVNRPDILSAPQQLPPPQTQPPARQQRGR